MEFGKYKGIPIDLIPNQYFKKLFEEAYMVNSDKQALSCKAHRELAKIKPELVRGFFLNCGCRDEGFSFGYLTKKKYGAKFEPVVAITCRNCGKKQHRRTSGDSFYRVGAIFQKMCNTHKCYEDMTVMITERPLTVTRKNKSYYRLLQKGVRSEKNIALGDLPYTSEDLRKHISSLFKENMSFENYGKWHIDHITPVSQFLFLGQDEFDECWSLDNLQPLWRHDNIMKGGFRKKEARWNILYEKYRRDENAL